MLTSSPQKLNKVLIGITFTISLLLLLVSSIPFEWQLVFFVLLMVVTGIPHGAVNHVVYQEVEKNKQASTNYLRFFMVYLGIILLYALLWYLLPQLCLAFSLLSFVGIALLLIGGQYLAEYISPYLLFFIAISLLTMPHMYYMQQLYTTPNHKK
ncbi:Brp/Blh family beta-carotene 15,15'-dioxygenase [Porifericola rhodea]|uniref:Brp/Blh family beta-carotene 15,15'-dioxygenase n=1 Tax=Porifericola rhodea TaxID=930972 RepID=UPI002665A1EC|nr:Brp/Blh family beta-carotene 15,15'-dioxygenase [Porifericola rhodea]WKN32708.1 Brp/Blh family beta-carotene 15,15'-dioxygenase [Porifericola rhodea]